MVAFRRHPLHLTLVTMESPPPPREEPFPDRVAATLSQQPGLPAPPDAAAAAPVRTRSRWPLWLGLGALVLVVTLVAVAAGSREHDALADEVAQLHRLHTSQVKALEEQMGAFTFGDLKIEVAAYGSGDEVELALFRYSNLPTAPQVDTMLRGAGGGIIGTGGTADFDAETVSTLDGVEYRCIPFTGRLFPDDPSETSGQVCAWAEGRDVTILMDARTSVASEAAVDAQAAHSELG
jgi:hypothetical protein